MPAGSRTAVIGPSGAGKSTLLGAIAGFIRPAAGRVLWDGRDLAPLAPGERPISLLFQDNNLFPHLTAAQNVGLGLRPDLGWTPRSGRRSPGRSPASASPGSKTASPPGSRAASKAAWRWPAPCCAPGRSCCSTNPLPPSGRR